MSKVRTKISVDVETDGPEYGRNSIVCFGAVVVDKAGKFDKVFYGKCKPESPIFNPDALAISGFTRRQHSQFPEAKDTMIKFQKWLKSVCGNSRPIFISDNNGYDWGWINYYTCKHLGENPFGWSSMNLANLYAGFMNDPRYRWRKHRRTKHDHDPVNDARGNAEALLHLIKSGFKMPLS